MAPDPKLPGTVTMTIKRDGDALFRQVPGWFAQEIFPESETVFFNATEDEQLTFVKNDKGKGDRSDRGTKRHVWRIRSKGIQGGEVTAVIHDEAAIAGLRGKET